jgi:hypothetical protein
MLSSEQVQQVRPRLLSIQIVSAALILSVSVFAVATSMIVDWENLNDRIKMLDLFASATGVLIFVLSIFAPGMFSSDITAASHSTSDQSSAVMAIANMILTENLIRFTLLEAAIFLNLMVFIIEPHIALLVVAGIGLLLMLVFFPRQSKMISHIENRIR